MGQKPTSPGFFFKTYRNTHKKDFRALELKYGPMNVFTGQGYIEAGDNGFPAFDKDISP